MNEKEREELSAYLDGETRPSARMEQLLREDPEAARYLAELRRVSERLHGLPEPEIHPAFVTRVMARVKDEPMEHRRPWVRVWLPVAAAAMLLLLVVGGYWLHQEGNQHPSMAKIPTPDLAVRAESNDASEEDALGTLGFEPLLIIADAETETPPPTEQEETLVLAALAEWQPGVLDSTPSDEWEAMLDSLSDEEAQALYSLMAEYAEQEDI